MSAIGKSVLKSIDAAIRRAESARAAVIAFENEHAQIIERYFTLYNAMKAADQAFETLVSSLTMLDAGQKEEFAPGWGVKRDSKREIRPEVILEKAHKFVAKNKDLVKFPVTALEAAVTRPRNGELLPADVFAEAVVVKPGAIRPLMRPYKE